MSVARGLACVTAHDPVEEAQVMESHPAEQQQHDSHDAATSSSRSGRAMVVTSSRPRQPPAQ
jgi:hypothetical protein